MEINNISEFRNRVYSELYENIAPFWVKYTMDKEFGGFYGRISNELKFIKKAHKSLILTARILWTFSALYRLEEKDEYLKMAMHGYHFLLDKFLDPKYGGSFWLVDYKGRVLETKKKIYGQAFSIYALVEYYSATKDPDALERAVNIFKLIEDKNHDDENSGYFEAANRDWSATEEMRLSEVDMNEVKSMNTHLHLMEAYTNLYRVWNDKNLEFRLNELIKVFLDHIINPSDFHMQLFFDEYWRPKSDIVSFGHDIEASWLLCETAEVLNDDKLRETIKNTALKLVDSTLRDGFNENDAIYTEMNAKGKVLKNIQWWPQAESVVGLLNAYKLSRNEKYCIHAYNAWQYIENHFVDRKNGEWFYEIEENGLPSDSYCKVSEWKGPYHNARACMEIIKRLSD